MNKKERNSVSTAKSRSPSVDLKKIEHMEKTRLYNMMVRAKLKIEAEHKGKPIPCDLYYKSLGIDFDALQAPYKLGGGNGSGQDLECDIENS